MLVGRLVWYGVRISRRPQAVPPRTERGLPQLMAHQPIAIDGAGADGRAEGAGTAEPGLSTDHGGDGASDEEVTVPSAPPKASARDKVAVIRYRVQKERRLSKPPKRGQGFIL